MNKKRRLKKSVVVILALIVIISVGCCVTFFGNKSTLKTLYPQHYSYFVEKYAKSNNLSEEFVYAVILCESSFDKNAVSNVGAKGLMQIMPDTFDWIQWRLDEDFSEEYLFDPKTAIRYGCYFYGYLMEKFGNEPTAVAAYHAGAARVTEWLADERYSDDGVTLKDIPYPSTKQYVERVMNAKAMYEKIYE